MSKRAKRKGNSAEGPVLSPDKSVSKKRETRVPAAKTTSIAAPERDESVDVTVTMRSGAAALHANHAFMTKSDAAAPLKGVTTKKIIQESDTLSAVEHFERLIAMSEDAAHAPNVRALVKQAVQDLADIGAGMPQKQRTWSVVNRTQVKQGEPGGIGDPLLEIPRGRKELVWSVTMLHNRKTQHAFGFSDMSVEHIDIKNMNVLRSITSALCAILNAWPYGPPESVMLKQYIFNAALIAATDEPMSILAPIWQKGMGFECRVLCIHPDTYEHYQHQFRHVKPFTFNDRPAYIPPSTNFHKSQVGRAYELVPKTVVNGVAHWESQLPEDFATHPVCQRKTQVPLSRAGLEAREHLMRLTAYVCRGMIATPEQIEEVYAMLEEAYGKPQSSIPPPPPPPFDQRLLCIPNFVSLERDASHPASVDFVFPTAVGNAIGQNWAATQGRHVYTVHIGDGRRIAKILTDTRHSLMKHYHVQRGLRDLATAIVDSYEAIERCIEPSGICACTSSDPGQHLCISCCRLFDCSKLSIDRSGLRKCATCDPLYHLVITKPGLAQHIALRVEFALQRDAASQKLAEGDLDDAINALTQNLVEKQQSIVSQGQEEINHAQSDKTMLFFDQFLNSITTSTGPGPWAPVVEAVLPHSVKNDGSLRFTDENTAVISTWLHFARGSYPLGMLQEAFVYARSKKSVQDRTRLLDRVDDMLMLAHLAPTDKATDADLRLLRELIISGKSLSAFTTEQFERCRRMRPLGQEASVCPWTDIQRSVIAKISSDLGGPQIVVTAPDGAPWLLQWGNLPSWYSWDWCWTFSRDLYLSWKTEPFLPPPVADNEITVWFETVRQLHDASRPSKLPLGLPPMPWKHSPLACDFMSQPQSSGNSMLTGWSLSPVSTADHKSDTGVLLTTKMDRMLAFTWPQTELDKFKILYQSSKFNVPRQWYDSASEPSSGHETTAGAFALHSAPPPLENIQHIASLAGVSKVSHAHPSTDSASLDASSQVDELPVNDEELHLDVQARAIGLALQREHDTRQVASTAADMLLQAVTSVPARPTAVTPSVELAVSAAMPSSVDVAAPAITQAITAISNVYAANQKRDPTLPVELETAFGDRLLPSLNDLESYKPPLPTQDYDVAYFSTEMLATAMDSLLQSATIPPHMHSMAITDAQFFLGMVEIPGWDIAGTITAQIQANFRKQDRSEESWPCAGMTIECTEVHSIMNDRGYHWFHVSFVVNKVQRSGIIYVRDSMQGARIRKWLHGFTDLFTMNPRSPWHGFTFDETPVYVNCPQQPDGHNCGPFAFESWRAAITQSPVKLFSTAAQATAHGHQLRTELLGNVFELATGRSFSELLQPTQAAVFDNLSFGLINKSKNQLPSVSRPAITPSMQLPTTETIGTGTASVIHKPFDSAAVTALPVIGHPRDVMPQAWAARHGSIEPTPLKVSSDTDVVKLLNDRVAIFKSFQHQFITLTWVRGVADAAARTALSVGTTAHATAADAITEAATSNTVTYDEAQETFTSAGITFDPVAGFAVMQAFAEKYKIKDTPWPSWCLRK